jgi:N-acetylglucosamine malate deacetylase 2
MMHILVIGAHPDDELFAGGTIARYAAEDHHVSLLVTTRGEGGNMGDPPLCTRAELGALREAECRACAAALGIRDVVFLPYRDPEIGPDHTLYHIDAPLDEFAAAIAAVVEAKRPDTIMTHGSGGEYGHPQHIYTHQAVLAALHNRPDLRPAELLTWCASYQGAAADDRMINRDDRADIVLDITPWLAQKRAGFEAHRTQLPVFTRGGRTLDEVVRPIESFRRVV